MYLYLNLKHHKCICSAPYLDSTGTFNQNNKQKQQNRTFWSPADHYRYRWWWLVTTGPISPGSGFRLFIDARNKAAVRMSLSVSDLKTTQDTDELPRHERHDEHIAPLWVLMKSQGSEFGMYYRAPEPRWWCTVWESCSITGCDWSSMSVCVCVCVTPNSGPRVFSAPHFTFPANSQMHPHQSPAPLPPAGRQHQACLRNIIIWQ